MDLSQMEKQGVTCSNSLTSKMTFERFLNDQGAPNDFNFIDFGITKPWDITRIKKRFGRWVRYNQPILFDKLYSDWLKGKPKIENNKRKHTMKQ